MNDRSRNGKLICGVLAAGALAALAATGRRSRGIRLDRKVVFITGGSRGLGFLLAREFAREGCRVAITARDRQELADAEQELEARGADVFTIVADVGNRNDAERAVAEAIAHFGRVDVVVNNAGIIQVGPLESMTIDDFREAMDVMYWGTVYTTLAALPDMRQRGEGAIVNITSIGAKASVPHLLPYSGAKFAAIGFSEGLHAEVAKDGIRVTTVVPGLMRTGSFLNAFFKGEKTEEYGWFATASSLPGLTIQARRAARAIVRATKSGRREIILTIPAKLLAIFHGMAPGATAAAMAATNRILPDADGEAATGGRIQGKEAHRRSKSKLLDGLTFFGRKAADRYQ
jgi:short-subunit dehydrogenase